MTSGISSLVSSSSTSTSSSSSSTSDATGIANNFSQFLTLLTTQMKNQDPLSPLDSNQFTAQLTQMAGVEQQLLTNDLLTSLLAAQAGGGLDNAANYIGKSVTAAWTASDPAVEDAVPAPVSEESGVPDDDRAASR